MRVAIVGAGPTGLYLAMALARRGHRVDVVDRDAGPRPDGSWPRRGVMQFHHPHGFRGQVVDALAAELPDVGDALLAAGAVPSMIPELPGKVIGLRCRRATFEQVLRTAAAAEPGVTLRIGHADEVRHEQGRAVGLVVEGQPLDADLVVDASGRSGRLATPLRAPAEESDCGIAYVSRQYELLPGADEGPVNSPVGLIVTYPGYQVIVFPHDNRTFSTLIARLASDRELARLRAESAYALACRVIPALASWTDPERSRPLTGVLPGGRLVNSYRGQGDGAGGLALPGLISVGDAVCTTTPTAGRGVTTSLMQARHLLGLLDQYGTDVASCALSFDSWCETTIRPWFSDHVAVDAGQVARWSGRDIDLDQKLPSDLIVTAAEADRSIMGAAGPYLTMTALPASLEALEPRARAIYRSGWRPEVPPGPSRDELVELLSSSGGC